ncbi:MULTISPECIES: DMT family transporter [unclassified Clostridium]|uniref:DMT family transporter n=1 Tax=unclassified Clostridium TaxID=2614128 RepID=UPI000297D31E|nr:MULTISPECIES: DMT family transporter [unclassified Clostridium]EKQ56770.1 MAG: putative permease [Clostridium sp. Maddingley MBC34-26]
MNTRRIYLLYFLLFIGVIALSTSAIFVKLSSASAPIIATYRMMFSAFILAPMLFLHKDNFKEMQRLTKNQWLLGILAGAFLALHYGLWFKSLRFTSIASSTIFVTLQPLFAFIGGYFFFGERLKGFAIGGGILAIVGSFIIGWGDFSIGGTSIYGDALALLGAATITVYFFIGQHLRKHLSLVPYALIAYSSSALFLLIYSLILRYPLTGYPSSDWIYFFGLAFVSTILGQTIFNWLIKWLSTSTISMSILGEPIGTCILAFFILGDTITLKQLIGSMTILFGIFLFLIYNQKATNPEIEDH